MAGGTGVTVQTSDGGSTWVRGPLPHGVAAVTAISCGSPTDCYAEAQPEASRSASSKPVILKSTDAGEKWKVLPTTPEVAGMKRGATLWCFGNATCWLEGSTISAGRSSGRGTFPFWKTTDGGATWTQSTSPTPKQPPWTCHTTDSGHQTCSGRAAIGLAATYSDASCATATECYVAGTNGVDVTHDGGRSWSPTTPTTLFSPRWLYASGTALMAVEETGGLQIDVSFDEGGEWQPSTVPFSIGPVSSIACFSNDSCLAISIPRLFVGSLQTHQWHAETIDGAEPVSGQISCLATNWCAVVVATPDRSNHLAWSNNAGATWTISSGQMPPATQNGFTLHCWIRTHCIAVDTYPANFHVRVTTNGGASWTLAEAPTDLGIPSCYSTNGCIARVVNTGSTPAAPNALTMASSVNGGEQWKTTTGPPGQALSFTPTCSPAGICWLLQQSAPDHPVLYRSLDDGNSWAPTDLTGYFIFPPSMACDTAGRCVAIGGRLTKMSDVDLMTTTNGGQSWVAHQTAGAAPNLADVSCFTTAPCVDLGTTRKSAPALSLNVLSGPS
jgi:hypothetical protein